MENELREVARILTEKETEIRELTLPPVWERRTEHLTPDEYRAFQRYVKDQQTTINALRFYFNHLRAAQTVQQPGR